MLILDLQRNALHDTLYYIFVDMRLALRFFVLITICALTSYSSSAGCGEDESDALNQLLIDFSFEVVCEENEGLTLNLVINTEAVEPYRVFYNNSFQYLATGETLSINYLEEERVQLTIFNEHSRARILNGVSWNCEQSDFYLLRETTECLQHWDWSNHYKLFPSEGSSIENLDFDEQFENGNGELHTIIVSDYLPYSYINVPFTDNPASVAVQASAQGYGECCQCDWLNPNWSLSTVSTVFSGSRYLLHEVGEYPFIEGNQFLQSPFNVMDIYNYIDFNKEYEITRLWGYDFEDDFPFQDVCFQQVEPVYLDKDWLISRLCDSYPQFDIVENSAFLDCDYSVDFELQVSSDFSVNNQYFLLYDLEGTLLDTIQETYFSAEILPEGLSELVLVQNLFLSRINELGQEEIVADCEIRSSPRDVYRIVEAPILHLQGGELAGTELSCCRSDGEFLTLEFEISNVVSGSWHRVLFVNEEGDIVDDFGSNIYPSITVHQYDYYDEFDAYLYHSGYFGNPETFSEVLGTDCNLISEPIHISLNPCVEAPQEFVTTASYNEIATIEPAYDDSILENQKVFYRVCRNNFNCTTYSTNQITFDSTTMELGVANKVTYIVSTDTDNDEIPDDEVQCAVWREYGELTWTEESVSSNVVNLALQPSFSWYQQGQRVHVELSDILITSATVTVLDLNGRVISQQSSFDKAIQIELSNLTNGIYLLNVRHNQESLTERVYLH